jgi:hypothetical protein
LKQITFGPSISEEDQATSYLLLPISFETSTARSSLFIESSNLGVEVGKSDDADPIEAGAEPNKVGKPDAADEENV